MHSQADISKALQQLGCQPTHSIARGLAVAIGWYKKNC